MRNQFYGLIYVQQDWLKGGRGRVTGAEVHANKSKANASGRRQLICSMYVCNWRATILGGLNVANIINNSY